MKPKLGLKLDGMVFQCIKGLPHQVNGYWKSTLKDPCVYCGGISDSKEHLIPRSEGGPNNWTNVVRACSKCNNERGRVKFMVFLVKKGFMHGSAGLQARVAASLGTSSLG